MPEGSNLYQERQFSEPLTSVERTRQYFEGQTVEELKADFESGRPIAILGTDVLIQINEAEAYPKVGPNYIKGKDGVNIYQPPGKIWTFHIPRARMNQALVTALHEGKPGACVRLLRASRYDKDSNLFVPMTREGDIARILELGENEVATLQFGEDMNDPNLYVIKSEGNNNSSVNLEEANKFISDLTG